MVGKKAEKLDIEELVEENRRILRELTKPFESFSRIDSRSKGLFSKPRDFRSECRDLDWGNINRIRESYNRASWEKLNGYFARLKISLASYPQEIKTYHGSTYQHYFERCIDRAVATDYYHENNPLKVEKATIHYLHYLELLHELLEKMVSALIEEKDTVDDVDFSVHKDSLIAKAKSIRQQIDGLQKKIQHYAVICHDYLWRRPEKNTKPDLKSVLTNLSETYTNAYQAINPFWRWMKYLCQNSERTQEIAFLKAVSDATDSDAIRIEAIRVMHNKIVSSETFGTTSKLRCFLASWGDIEIDSLDDASSLSDLIDQHEDLKNMMPPSFAAYYEATKRLPSIEL